ncbi:MAG: hypothetical protein NVSMB13_04770 [Mycobacteriales bacterium]
MIVRTASMAPALQRGDVVMLDRGLGAVPNRGAVVSVPTSTDAFDLRRVTLVEEDGSVHVKSDAAATEDAPVTAAGVKGIARLLVPLVGRPALWLERRVSVPSATWVGLTLVALYYAATGDRRRRKGHHEPSGSQDASPDGAPPVVRAPEQRRASDEHPAAAGRTGDSS